MEHFKVFRSSNDSAVSKFVTIKSIAVSGQSKSVGQYSANKNIRFKTPMLRSDMCDYRDVVIETMNLKLLQILI